MSRVTISIWHRTGRKSKNDKHPVKLRVYYKNQAKFFPTGIRATVDEFKNSYLTDRPKKEYRKLKEDIVTIESKARTILAGMKTFDIARFTALLSGPSGAGDDVLFSYNENITRLTKENQLKTAKCYENARNSLIAYLKHLKKDESRLPYHAITAPWLTSYERWMEHRKRSVTTVSIYLRTLRTIFNEALNTGVIDREDYPFGKGKFIIPVGPNTKKALTKEQLSMLLKFPLQPGTTAMARDFFFFSYICNGINFKDISRLRYQNITGDTLTFIREKTKQSRRGSAPTQIRAYLNDFAKQVISKYGNKDTRPTSLIFPVIKDTMTERQKMVSLYSFIKLVNTGLKKLAKDAGIDRDISTYFARHSFSTVALHSGATVEFISESLGHSSIKTTQNYLAGFPDDIKKEIAGKLMDF